LALATVHLLGEVNSPLKKRCRRGSTTDPEMDTVHGHVDGSPSAARADADVGRRARGGPVAGTSVLRDAERSAEGGGVRPSRRGAGIYALGAFVADKKTNVFMVEERELQKNDALRALVNRLLDYRIIHSVGTALTHKSHPESGTFQAFAIDVGAYAHMRKLYGKFTEIDLERRS
jgi:hypothetical protein